MLFFFFGIIALILLLPRGMGGEGVKLERLNSVVLKVENYQKSMHLVSQSPLVGFGYDNLCSVKVRWISADPAGNSCSGLDNSFLFVLATTGIIGLICFLKALYSMVRTTASTLEGKSFIASSIALLVHTQFTNTLFYSWVIVWMAFLYSISRKNQLE